MVDTFTIINKYRNVKVVNDETIDRYKRFERDISVSRSANVSAVLCRNLKAVDFASFKESTF